MLSIHHCYQGVGHHHVRFKLHSYTPSSSNMSSHRLLRAEVSRRLRSRIDLHTMLEQQACYFERVVAVVKPLAKRLPMVLQLREIIWVRFGSQMTIIHT